MLLAFVQITDVICQFGETLHVILIEPDAGHGRPHVVPYVDLELVETVQQLMFLQVAADLPQMVFPDLERRINFGHLSLQHIHHTFFKALGVNFYKNLRAQLIFEDVDQNLVYVAVPQEKFQQAEVSPVFAQVVDALVVENRVDCGSGGARLRLVSRQRVVPRRYLLQVFHSTHYTQSRVHLHGVV